MFAKYKITVTATTNFCVNALDFVRFLFLYKLFNLILNLMEEIGRYSISQNDSHFTKERINVEAELGGR